VAEPARPRSYHHGDLRAALLDAAGRCLRERGAAQLSLRDLAREVGVSHAAPRRHFADRQELLDALAVAGFERLGGVLHEALGEAGTEFPARVHGAVSALARFATEDAALFELMHTNKHRPGATRVAAAAAAAFAPVVELVEEGQARGELRAGDPQRIGVVVFATVLGITTMINGGTLGAELLDPLVDAAVDQFLRGARPPA
jgi:AcrR family transcriptional regulator